MGKSQQHSGNGSGNQRLTLDRCLRFEPVLRAEYFAAELGLIQCSR